MTAKPCIQIQDVDLDYQTDSGALPVLRDLSFDVPKGSMVAVVGPSGCGKSTLTKLVAGLLKPKKGEVILDGEKVTSPRSTVGMAFQNPVMLEWRNILKNVLLPMEIIKGAKLSKAEAETRARDLLTLVGLQGFEDKRPSELSGGMRQRASLCRSMVHNPEVLILDEPFGALDAFTREDLWVTMREIRARENITSMLITHDLRESVFLADTVVVLSNRPATVQYTLNIDLGDKPSLDDLYSNEALTYLKDLRHQIQVAQGRVENIGREEEAA